LGLARKEEDLKRNALLETAPPALDPLVAAKLESASSRRAAGHLTLTEQETEMRRKIVRLLYAAGILLSAEAIQHILKPDCVLVLTSFAVHQGDGMSGYIAPLLNVSGPVLAASMQLTVHLVQQLADAGSRRCTWT
jgi:hypothetical protein